MALTHFVAKGLRKLSKNTPDYVEGLGGDFHHVTHGKSAKCRFAVVTAFRTVRGVTTRRDFLALGKAHESFFTLPSGIKPRAISIDEVPYAAVPLNTKLAIHQDVSEAFGKCKKEHHEGLHMVIAGMLNTMSNLRPKR